MGRKRIIFITTIIGILCLISGYYSAFYLHRYYCDWNTVVAIGTWVSTFIIALGIGFGFLQLREARLGTNAQVAMDMFRELRSDKSIEIFHFIYGLDPKNPAIVYVTDIDRINYLLDRFDFLAVLVNKGIIEKDLAIDPYAGVPALRCWYILYDYINETRKIRKYFGDNFEGFTNECIKYFDEHDIEIGFKNQYVEIDDLVKILKNAEREYEETKKILYPRSLDKIIEARKQLKRDRK